MPDPYSRSVYRVQVGSFADTNHAQRSFNQLQSAGFNPFFEQFNSEQYGAMCRVVIVGIKAADMASVIQRLEAAGFTDVWLREEK